MPQHSWYDKRIKRHYGFKPNTRRARGLKRRDAGKPGKPQCNAVTNFLPSCETDTSNVEKVNLPQSKKVLKRYIDIYNYYVSIYDSLRDQELCIEQTAERFIARKGTVMTAIKICKYILATTPR